MKKSRVNVKSGDGVTYKVPADSILVRSEKAIAFKVGDEIRMFQKSNLPANKEHGMILNGSKKTAIRLAHMGSEGIDVGAMMRLRDLEKVVKEARKRMEKFKKLNKKRGKSNRTIIITHLSPDIHIVLEE